MRSECPAAEMVRVLIQEEERPFLRSGGIPTASGCLGTCTGVQTAGSLGATAWLGVQGCKGRVVLEPPGWHAGMC